MAGRERALDERGFLIVPGPVSKKHLQSLRRAYDAVMQKAAPHEVAHGSSTTRLHDFVNRGPEFDSLYVHEPLLSACQQILDGPFKLSTMLARTLRSQSAAQKVHADSLSENGRWTTVGFIFMVDDFREDNGATRFLPGSHLRPPMEESLGDLQSDVGGQVLACGAAGSMIIYNGSVWHGHVANRCQMPRRSIQGAFIRREAESWTNFRDRMTPDTMGRISPLAKYLLAV